MIIKKCVKNCRIYYLIKHYLNKGDEQMIFGSITIEHEQLDIIKQAIEQASLDTTLENLLLWNGAIRFISQKITLL